MCTALFFDRLPPHCNYTRLPPHCNYTRLPPHCNYTRLPPHCNYTRLPPHCNYTRLPPHCNYTWLPPHCNYAPQPDGIKPLSNFHSHSSDDACDVLFQFFQFLEVLWPIILYIILVILRNKFPPEQLQDCKLLPLCTVMLEMSIMYSQVSGLRYAFSWSSTFPSDSVL